MGFRKKHSLVLSKFQSEHKNNMSGILLFFNQDTILKCFSFFLIFYQTSWLSPYHINTYKFITSSMVLLCPVHWNFLFENTYCFCYVLNIFFIYKWLVRDLHVYIFSITVLLFLFFETRICRYIKMFMYIYITQCLDYFMCRGDKVHAIK